jgi:hypothetical protein
MEGGLTKDKNLKKIIFFFFFSFLRKGERKKDGG